MKIERPNWLNSIIPNSSPMHVLLIFLIIILILLLLSFGTGFMQNTVSRLCERSARSNPGLDCFGVPRKDAKLSRSYKSRINIANSTGSISASTIASSTQSASVLDSIKDLQKLNQSAQSITKITPKPKPKPKTKKVVVVEDIGVKFSAPFVIESSTTSITTDANGSSTPIADAELSTTTDKILDSSDLASSTTVSLAKTVETPVATTSISSTSTPPVIIFIQEPMHVTMLGGGGGGAPAPTPAATPPPATVPDAVSNLDSGLVADTSVQLTWTSPSDGGSAITGYEIRYSDGLTASTSVFILASPNIVTPLSDGVTYFFEIYAGNIVGTSTVSNIYSTTTLVSAPPPPPD